MHVEDMQIGINSAEFVKAARYISRYSNFIYPTIMQPLYYEVSVINGDRVSTVVKVLCATNRKVVVSIPAGVSGFFIDIKSFRSDYGPGVDSASNRNEYQDYFLGVKAAGT